MLRTRQLGVGGDAEEGQPQVLDELRTRAKGELHCRVKASATEEGRQWRLGRMSIGKG